jgi:hypothetical protein
MLTRKRSSRRRRVIPVLMVCFIGGSFLNVAGQGSAPAPASDPRPTSDARGVFEFRIYNVKPGAMATMREWMAQVQDVQERLNPTTRIVGQFTDEKANKYVWIRMHENEAARRRFEAAQAGSAEWRALAARRTESGLLDGDVYLATPTVYSRLDYAWGRFAGQAGEPIVTVTPNPVEYEFRVYQARAGELDDLVTWMGASMIPFQETHGVPALGQFVAFAKESGGRLLPVDNVFIWARIFRDPATKVAMAKLIMHRDQVSVVGAPRGLERGLGNIAGSPTPFSRLQ